MVLASSLAAKDTDGTRHGSGLCTSLTSSENGLLVIADIMARNRNGLHRVSKI